MNARYRVVNAVPWEGYRVDSRRPIARTRGFQVLDILLDKRRAEIYRNRLDAQVACEELNRQDTECQAF